VTAGELREADVETIGDLAAADESRITDRYGERGRELYRRARGADDREVRPVGEPKSLSRESAFPGAVESTVEKREKIETLAAAVADRARREGALYRTVGIKVVEPPFEVNTRAESLSGPVDDPDLVREIALDLLAEFRDAPVRKLGVRVSNLSFAEGDQADLGGWDDTVTREDGETTRGGEGTTTEERDDGPRRGERGQASLGDFGGE